MAKRILTIVGARPQFIKAAPVSKALAEAGIEEALVHTGQHFDEAMSGVFFEELAIARPKHNLGVNSLGHGAMTGRMLEGIEAIILAEKPDMTLVYGDTNSTLAGALASAKLNIPVAHVEAGLRSFNRRMPEETNRVLADHVSALLFCPTRTAVANLEREGIAAGVFAVGDVMYDATITAAARAETASRILEREGLVHSDYAVATIHRAENTDNAERFDAVMSWIEAQARVQTVVFPCHPRTRQLVEGRVAAQGGGLRLIDPLGYLDMTRLVANARAVFTDSGGLQKEAYFHKVPCVTLRDETEWVETIEAGWNRLWTVPEYRPRGVIDDYGTGDAAVRIVEALAAY